MQPGFVTASPPSCVDNICLTPTELTGKYYAVGLMIQSGGNGMNAYFGQDQWSDITGTSPTFDFSFKSPITQAGDLICCTSEGDLSGDNTYFSDAIYLFGYIDATFTIAADSGAHGDAVGTHTVRFVLADDSISGGKRGDLLIKDAEEFKWMDAAGALSTSRPADAITMNEDVVAFPDPYGDGKGTIAIPIIRTSVNAPASGEVFQVSEEELKIADRTYSFDFNASGFVWFPTLLQNDIGMLESRKALLSKIHMQGLPHSQYGDGGAYGASGDTTLTITAP